FFVEKRRAHLGMYPPRLEERVSLLRRRNVVEGVAADRARRIRRAERLLHLLFRHAGMNLLHVHIHKDVAMMIDLRATAAERRKQNEAREAKQPRGAHSPIRRLSPR